MIYRFLLDLSLSTNLPYEPPSSSFNNLFIGLIESLVPSLFSLDAKEWYNHRFTLEIVCKAPSHPNDCGMGRGKVAEGHFNVAAHCQMLTVFDALV